jgi:hypothetical protein
MPTNYEHFLRLSAHAARDGEAERARLAADLAASFATDPEAFDPQRLLALGLLGLRSFIDEIASAEPPNPQEIASPPVAPQDWLAEERPKFSFTTDAIVLALVFSSLLFSGAIAGRLIL